MSEAITITIPGAPVAKGRPRFGKGRTFTPAKTRDYETYARLVANTVMAGRPPLVGALAVTVEALLPVPASWSKGKAAAALLGLELPTSKPDADNLQKCIFDSVNGCVWLDDAQVVDARVIKKYSATPSVTMSVRQIIGGAVT